MRQTLPLEALQHGDQAETAFVLAEKQDDLLHQRGAVEHAGARVADACQYRIEGAHAHLTRAGGIARRLDPHGRDARLTVTCRPDYIAVRWDAHGGGDRGRRYNRRVIRNGRQPLADDTSPDAERVQIDHWRRMSPSQKAQLTSSLCRHTNALAAEGVRLRHPDAAPRERFLRLAIVRLGYDLAVQAFPEAAGLEP